jgi:hypothetical protein
MRISWVLNTTELTIKGYQAIIKVLLFPKLASNKFAVMKIHSWREDKKE